MLRAIVLALFALFTLAGTANAVVSAAEAMTAAGFTPQEQKRILGGEMVGADLPSASERDLSVKIAFLVKTSPQELSRQVLTGELSKADDQITARGDIGSAGGISDFSGVKLEPGAEIVAREFAAASPGTELNLSTREIETFRKAGSAEVRAVEDQLRKVLLARYQAYRAKGLAGIEPYDRGGAARSDLAADLRKVSAAPLLRQFFPSLQKALVSYPAGQPADLTEKYFWVNNRIDDKPTFALTHVLAASEGDARIVVQRQFYVSRSYNGQQAVATFLPVEQGTLVLYATHTFTDQVSGFGASMKQGIGRKMMGGKLQELFEKARTEAEKH
jgi:hypothetical protein